MTTGTFLIKRTLMSGVEAVEAETDHVFPKHTHDQFGIGIVRRGAQTSLSGRGMVDAVPGDIITVNPGEVHDGAPIGDQGRAWMMLYFNPAVIGDIADDIGLRANDYEFRYPVLADRSAADLFVGLYTALVGGADSSLLQSDGMLLALVRRLVSERAITPLRAAASGISRAKSLIDDAPVPDLTLADLARASGLSRFQTLRGFVRLTGMTPHAYVMQVRTNLARRLIRQRLALAEVAAASGFADQSHMNRTFLRRYGITPGAYASAVA